MISPQDQLLLHQAQQGNAQAFEALVTPHEAMLWRLCWRYTRNEADAQDCMQDTMLKAWRSFATFHGECALQSWLYRIAASCCLDFLRRRQCSPQPLAEDAA